MSRHDIDEIARRALEEAALPDGGWSQLERECSAAADLVPRMIRPRRRVLMTASVVMAVSLLVGGVAIGAPQSLIDIWDRATAAEQVVSKNEGSPPSKELVNTFSATPTAILDVEGAVGVQPDDLRSVYRDAVGGTNIEIAVARTDDGRVCTFAYLDRGLTPDCIARLSRALPVDVAFYPVGDAWVVWGVTASSVERVEVNGTVATLEEGVFVAEAGVTRSIDIAAFDREGTRVHHSIRMPPTAPDAAG